MPEYQYQRDSCDRIYIARGVAYEVHYDGQMPDLVIIRTPTTAWEEIHDWQIAPRRFRTVRVYGHGRTMGKKVPEAVAGEFRSGEFIPDSNTDARLVIPFAGIYDSGDAIGLRSGQRMVITLPRESRVKIHSF
ncbi:MAG TPA: hypothetical protein VK497_04605 [Candidatus Saccharimonadales bacterium]|nr:hypothetical protein [Candidatus Saccharimonadales bacterium]